MVGNSFKRSQWKTVLSGSTGFGYFLGRVAPRLGAVCDQTQTRGPWPIANQSRHIDELELLEALFAQTGATSPPPVRQISADRMAVIRGRFKNQGIPSNVIDLLMTSNRQTTTAAYHSTWTHWLDWCDKRNTDPMSPSINSLLQYFFPICSKQVWQLTQLTFTAQLYR